MSKNKRGNEAGLVAIMVTLIMMIIITLIVLGFATVVRRNSREALDRQLSSQAYYAAESGVNDAVTALFKNNYAPSLVSSDATTCSGPGSFIVHAATKGMNATISTSSGVQYTCVLVNPTPSSLIATVSASGQQKVIKAEPSTNTHLNFQWVAKGANGNQNASGCGNNAPWGTWTANCPYGLLRLDIFTPNGSTDPNVLAAQTATVFVSPHSGNPATPPTVAIANNTPVNANANCAAGTCSINLSATGGTNFIAGVPYYIRLTSVYEDLGNVGISGTAAGTTFLDGQYLIDATGKAQDELRRIQVRVQPDDVGTLTAFDALASGKAICKQYLIAGPGQSPVPNNLCN